MLLITEARQRIQSPARFLFFIGDSGVDKMSLVSEADACGARRSCEGINRR